MFLNDVIQLVTWFQNEPIRFETLMQLIIISHLHHAQLIITTIITFVAMNLMHSFKKITVIDFYAVYWDVNYYG